MRFCDCLQVGFRVYILLEYAANGCLFFYINPRAGLPEHLALRFFRQAALAVQYLHAQGIVHRDIKPENLLLDEQFDIKLCDFGWATALDSEHEFKTSICGTYEYMSPEIVYEQTHTAKTDVWCLGIFLYEMLHGRPPFKAEDFASIKREFSEKKIEIFSDFATDTKSLLRALLETDPRKRLDIDRVLQHPAMTRGAAVMARPLTSEEIAELIATYLRNTNNGQVNDAPVAVVRKQIAADRKNMENFFGEAAQQFRTGVDGFFEDIRLDEASLGALSFPETGGKFRSSKRNDKRTSSASEKQTFLRPPPPDSPAETPAPPRQSRNPPSPGPGPVEERSAPPRFPSSEGRQPSSGMVEEYVADNTLHSCLFLNSPVLPEAASSTSPVKPFQPKLGSSTSLHVRETVASSTRGQGHVFEGMQTLQARAFPPTAEGVPGSPREPPSRPLFQPFSPALKLPAPTAAFNEYGASTFSYREASQPDPRGSSAFTASAGRGRLETSQGPGLLEFSGVSQGSGGASKSAIFRDAHHGPGGPFAGFQPSPYAATSAMNTSFMQRRTPDILGQPQGIPRQFAFAHFQHPPPTQTVALRPRELRPVAISLPLQVRSAESPILRRADYKYVVLNGVLVKRSANDQPYSTAPPPGWEVRPLPYKSSTLNFLPGNTFYEPLQPPKAQVQAMSLCFDRLSDMALKSEPNRSKGYRGTSTQVQPQLYRQIPAFVEGLNSSFSNRSMFA